MLKTPLSNVSEQQAYEWVKTGHWSKREFIEWVEAVKEERYNRGYDDADSMHAEFNAGASL